jgi:malate dehydrogenase
VRVAIVGGAGGVGSSVAYNLLLLRRGYDVLLVDRRPKHVLSHVMDLEQTLELGATGSVRGAESGEVGSADVAVVTAGAPFAANTPRDEYLAANVPILEEVAAAIPADWGGTVVLVTNPVDVLCTWLQRRTGLSRRRILGYTMNDSLRFRTGIGAALGVAAGSVEAWVLGEHGDHCVFLFDRVRHGGEPLELSSDQQAAAEAFARGWYPRHVALDSGRTSTWTSGLGVARMVDAVATGASETWTASVVLDGEYGIEDVAVSIPVSFELNGSLTIEEWELRPEQLAQLHAAADHVRRLVP